MSVSSSFAAPTSLPSIPDGSICTPEQRALSTSTNPTLHCLARGQTVGLTLLTTAAFFSVAAVGYVFVRIVLNVIRAARRSPGKWRLVKGPMDVYMISLFCANFFHAIGHTLNIRWLHEGIVRTGSYCSAQGFIQQAGSMTLGLTTLLIAVHTFVAVWWSRGLKSLFVPRFAVCFVWLMAIVFEVAFTASHRHSSPSYYSPSPYWCYVDQPYVFRFGIAGEYLWLWLALLVSLLTYIPLFLFFLGYITVNKDEPWWRCHWNGHRQPVEGAQRQAFTMIIYPLAFTVLVLPLSIVRFINFGLEDETKPDLAPRNTFATVILYNLSGIVEVILFFKTRQGLLLFGEDDGCDGVMDHPLVDERSPVSVIETGMNGQESNRSPGVNLFDDDEV